MPEGSRAAAFLEGARLAVLGYHEGLNGAEGSRRHFSCAEYS